MSMLTETRAKRQGTSHFPQHFENPSEQAVLQFSAVPRGCSPQQQPPEVALNFGAVRHQSKRGPEVGWPEFLPPNLPHHLLCQKITRRARNSFSNPITCHFLRLQSRFRTAGRRRLSAGLASCSSARYPKSTYFPAATTREWRKAAAGSAPF